MGDKILQAPRNPCKKIRDRQGRGLFPYSRKRSHCPGSGLLAQGKRCVPFVPFGLDLIQKGKTAIRNGSGNRMKNAGFLYGWSVCFLMLTPVLIYLMSCPTCRISSWVRYRGLAGQGGFSLLSRSRGSCLTAGFYRIAQPGRNRSRQSAERQACLPAGG